MGRKQVRNSLTNWPGKWGHLNRSEIRLTNWHGKMGPLNNLEFSHFEWLRNPGAGQEIKRSVTINPNPPAIVGTNNPSGAVSRRLNLEQIAPNISMLTLLRPPGPLMLVLLAQGMFAA